MQKLLHNLAVRNVFILGDSIAKGVTYSEEKQRYTILQENCIQRLCQDTGASITNLAAMGRTSVDAFNMLKKAQPKAGDVVVLEFGGNDSDMPWQEVSQAPQQEHFARVPLDIFTQQMQQLIAQVRQLGATPVLTTPLPVDADRYFSWVTRSLDADAVLQWLGDVHHIYRWQERYANAVRNISAKENVLLIDLRDAFLSCGKLSDLYCRDGIHPNAMGHDVLYHAAMPYLLA